MSTKYNKIELNQLKIGMAFTAPLVHPVSYKLLLPQSYPIFHAFIEECQSQDIEVVLTTGNIISEPHEYPNIAAIYISLELRSAIQLYYDSIQILKKQFSDPKNIKLPTFQELISKWISNTHKNNSTQLYLQIIRHTYVMDKDYFYAHLLDVMLFSIPIYIIYKKDPSFIEIMQLAMGALLYDIGMILLPDYIKFHTEEYDEAMIKQVHTHPILGFKFLMSVLKIPSTFAYPALEHHERLDGSGYPYGIKGHHMYENSIIISLADIFTSQMRSRPYREAKEPAEILKDFLVTTMPLFEKRAKVLLKAVISYLTIYPITSYLLLSTGEVGIVIDNFITTPLKPNVMILLDKDGQIDYSRKIVYLSDPDYEHISITGIFGHNHLKKLEKLHPTPIYSLPETSSAVEVGETTEG
ncbi:MAG: HD-GYP domain-containing protein [Brevinema sp.]